MTDEDKIKFDQYAEIWLMIVGKEISDEEAISEFSQKLGYDRQSAEGIIRGIHSDMIKSKNSLL
jgi:hypothetical protein